MRLSAYLAGPDVFLPDAPKVGARKKAICERYGISGHFPLDAEISFRKKQERDLSDLIFDANISLMRSCDLIIANLTPFRGPSADVGTAFELGFMFALGKPIYAYSNIGGTYADRVKQFFGGTSSSDISDRLFAKDKMAIEDFGLPDNLMLYYAAKNGVFLVPKKLTNSDNPQTDLELFESCVSLAAKEFKSLPRSLRISKA